MLQRIDKRTLSFNHTDVRLLRRATAKRNAQADSKKNRKHECPENGFWLSNESAKPRERQLNNRSIDESAARRRSSSDVTHRVMSSPSIQRTHLPALPTSCAAQAEDDASIRSSRSARRESQVRSRDRDRQSQPDHTIAQPHPCNASSEQSFVPSTETLRS